MNFIGLLRMLERPPRMGHDVDVKDRPCDTGDWYDAHGHVCPHHCFDGAEQLAEREAEGEVSEPVGEILCPTDGGRCECDRTSQGCAAYHRQQTSEPHECAKCGRISPKCKSVNTWVGERFYCPECPPYPHEDGAEQLAEREAEEEVGEPRDIDSERRQTDITDVPDREPGLSDDELVGVRGLLQERYETQPVMPCPVDDCEFEGSSCDEVNTHSYWDHLQPNPFETSTDPLVEYKRYPGVTEAGDFRWFNVKVTKSSASNHTGTAAEPAPSPTIVQSAPPPTVDGEGGGGALHSPGARLPHPDDAVAEWIGEAVPVISQILSHHVTVPLDNREVMCLCIPQKALIFPNNAAWRQHVAPIIANALAPQDK